jgi:gliding motility-associated-like protein
MRRNLLLLLICPALAAPLAAQTQLCFQNPSLEGTSQPHVVPAPWQNCYGSPDTQPGQWGITQPASNGNTYVSFLQSGWSSNGYTEGMTQILSSPMTAGTPYSFQVDLAHTNIYNTASPNGCYSSLAVWGGMSPCAQTQLLWTSGSFMHTNWQTYTVSFTPTGNWSYISFCPYYITTCGSTGFDYINCMLDNLTCVSPSSNVTGTNAMCSTTCDGTATCTPSNGTPPYTFLWTPGNLTTQTITGLCPGTYSCVCSDANGVTTSGSYTVNAPSALSAAPASTNILCNGQCNGTATVTVSGGTAPYTYTWSVGNQSTTSISNLCQGSYSVTVTDTNGCTLQQTFTITEPPGITANATSTATTCGNNNGTASVTASGGTGTLTYAWSPSGGNNSTASNLAAGSYTVLVTDANGCTQTATVNVAPSSAPTVTLQGQTNLTCATGTNGDATVTVNGGASPYTYAWSPSGGTAATATGLGVGTYTCTITDAAGCTITQTVTITAPPPITASSSTTFASCQNNDGTATATANGGTGTLTYLWSPSGGTSANATGLSVGTYTCTITDANGCTQTTTCTVVFSNPPVANAGPDVTIQGGSSTGIAATGGGTYSWSPSTGLSCTTCANPNANPFETTEYCVTVTDQNGCTATDCMTITVDVPCPTNGDFSAPNAFSPNDDGHNDVFTIQGWKPCMTDFKMIIYDRWGEKVFESTDITLGWDGTYKGKQLDAGVFLYYVTAKLPNGALATKKGNISLVR